MRRMSKATIEPTTPNNIRIHVARGAGGLGPSRIRRARSRRWQRRSSCILGLVLRPDCVEVPRAVNEPHYVDPVGGFNLVDKAIAPNEQFPDLGFANFRNH